MTEHTPINFQLDNDNRATAQLAHPGVWHIKRVDPFGKTHTVILTSETLQFLAERDKFYGSIQQPGQ